MADEFRRNWVESHYEEPEKVEYRDLETDYWRLVKNVTGEAVEVEYGNDLTTQEYGSGFPVRRASDPPLGATEASFGSEEYYRTCGWNLNNISAWPGSAINCVTHSIDGINKPWLYLGMMFSSFCWHREDIYLASINYNHAGDGKQWYGIPGTKAKAFKSVMEKLMKLRLKEVPDLEHHITTQIAPETLLSNGVPVYKTRQEAGQFIVTFPEAYHAGFSYGFNCGEAVNFATSDWIPHGSQSVVDYRLKGKREVFSFDRLLFTLTYHLPKLSLESCNMLLKELEVLQADEAYFRKLLYDTGVQDVSKVVTLPTEGRMSAAIPEELANYDDQRVCATCQHTCFLSAVCCNCRSEARDILFGLVGGRYVAGHDELAAGAPDSHERRFCCLPPLPRLLCINRRAASKPFRAPGAATCFVVALERTNFSSSGIPTLKLAKSCERLGSTSPKLPQRPHRKRGCTIISHSSPFAARYSRGARNIPLVLVLGLH